MSYSHYTQYHKLAGLKKTCNVAYALAIPHVHVSILHSKGLAAATSYMCIEYSIYKLVCTEKPFKQAAAFRLQREGCGRLDKRTYNGSKLSRVTYVLRR